MKFFYEVDTEATREQIATYANVTYACSIYSCSSENTVETANLVPSGLHFTVLCENGHETNGIPPARFRNK